ncbi:hypothetical protein D3C77_712750 [compost metagenome]
MIKENHYKLLFLSWLPQKLANKYISLFRGIDQYYEKHLSYHNLRRLVSKFMIYDYTEEIIKLPEKYFENDRTAFKLLRILPVFIRKYLLRNLTQTFIWVIKK